MEPGRTVVGHVRCDEHILRQSIIVQILVEQGEVLDHSQAVFVIGN